MAYGTIKVTRLDGSIIDIGLTPEQSGHIVAVATKGDETLYLYRTNHQWYERTKDSQAVYLADGRELYAEIALQDDENGVVTLEGKEIKVGSLAAPYEFLGYGELVEITLQNGDQFYATLQPQEYRNHFAYIQLRDTVFISVCYDQVAGQWRELTDQEYDQDRRALEADMKDMAQIAREWEEYRRQGDETPPSKLSYLY